MRDVIWTIIVIWIIWKIYDAFTNASKLNKQKVNQNEPFKSKEGEVIIEKKTNQKTHFNPDNAEYVDYEEIK